MTGRNHATVAAAAVAAPYLASRTVLTTETVVMIVASVVFAVFASLLPDIDQPGSRISNLRIFGVRWFYFPSLAVSSVLRHRGPTHSLLVWALCSWAFLALCRLVGSATGVETFPLFLAFAAGYLSHLFLDALTVGGVPLFWPQKRAIHALPRFMAFSTGSTMEHIVTAGLVMGIAGFVYLQRLPR